MKGEYFMGKLSIKGKAEREVQYDAVEVAVTICTCSDTSAEAVSKLMEQSERFLELITAAGVDMKDVRLIDTSIDQDYDDGEQEVLASRGMEIRLKFNMAFINSLMELIRKQDLTASLNCSYLLTNKKEIHDELLREAIADSRKKAEDIARVIGQKVVGIDSVEYDKYNGCDWDFVQEYRSDFMSNARLSDKIEAPIKKEDESIEIVWLIE